MIPRMEPTVRIPSAAPSHVRVPPELEGLRRLAYNLRWVRPYVERFSSGPFKRLNFNEIDDARSFQRTMRDINFAFNWFYADDRDIAWTLSGWYPRRAKGTHPDFPAWGTGRWDWQGFNSSDYSSKRISARKLPRSRNPGQGYLVNWNNKQAPGWRSADDYWNYGSIQRVTHLKWLGARAGGWDCVSSGPKRSSRCGKRAERPLRSAWSRSDPERAASLRPCSRPRPVGSLTP